MEKEKNLTVEVVHGCYTGVNDSFPSVALGNLTAALGKKLQDD